jgi:putative N6-adenine-specific DNA methylase
MNLDKRIKRHVIGPRHDFFAVTLPGHEALGCKELEGLSPTVEPGAPAKGGAAFSGRLTDLYLANLHLRLAGRILMRIASFKAAAFNRLERQARALAWSLYLPGGEIPKIQVAAHHSRLYHTQAVSERIQASIADHWTGLGIQPAPSQDQTLFLRLLDDTVTLSLDSSGENLYRRGLKTHAGQAPLRETLAALILQIAGYCPDQPLLDPMCGAGTFSLEAALMAKAVAPGLHRRFAFMQWPSFRSAQWEHLRQRAALQIKILEQPTIWASDRDAAACTRLSACIAQNNLSDAVRVAHKEFFDLRPGEMSKQPGLIVLNPPYGRRLTAPVTVESLYRQIAVKLRQDFKGWKAALLVPDEGLARHLDLPLRPFRLAHGGLTPVLLTGRMP